MAGQLLVKTDRFQAEADVIEDLRKRIEAYLSSGKHRTLHSLSSGSGVSYSTLRRIAQGETKTVELSSVLGILKVVGRWDESLAFLKEHFPSAGNYFAAGADALQVEDWTTNIEEALERSLYDYDGFVIVSLAATLNGTTEAEIATALGSHAAKTVESLLDSGVLVLKSGRIFTSQINFSPYDNTVIKAELQHCSRFIRDENIGKERQHCALRTRSVTREGQCKVHQIIQKALLDADEVIAEHQGGVPIFYGALMGAFLPGGDQP